MSRGEDTGSHIRQGEATRPESGVVRHEEQIGVDVADELYGTVRARKHVDTEHVQRVEGRSVEYGEVERVAVGDDGDSGEIEHLADGSVSIPLFEERLVVRKELVVRERVVIRKRTVTEEHVVEADLRKERIEVEGDVEGGPAPA